MPTSTESKVIFLTGFMGSGKTTLGRSAASQLGLGFFDLDEEIERRTQQAIAQLFAQGEPSFREHEHRILVQLLDEMSGQPAVVALGGGTYAHPSNQPLIHPGRLIFLDVPFSVLKQRVATCSHRPLARDLVKLKRLHDQRIPIYSQAKTTLALSANDDLVCAAQKLAACLRGLLDEGRD